MAPSQITTRSSVSFFGKSSPLEIDLVILVGGSIEGARKACFSGEYASQKASPVGSIITSVFVYGTSMFHTDGFSKGSNDLASLVLGVNRDNSKLAKSVFDERNPAVKFAIEQLIKTAHKHGIKIGICGQAPSDYPENC